jgi:hypothetical protein
MKLIYKHLFTYTALIGLGLNASTSSFSSSLPRPTVNPVQASVSSVTSSLLMHETNKEPQPGYWSVLVENYSVHHQGHNLLNIMVSCDYTNRSQVDLPDASTVYHEIVQFLNHYPDNADYWEVVNRNLIEHIHQNHPALSSITVSLEVLANQTEPYTRSTTATRHADGRILESWSFITAQVAVSHQGEQMLNIQVDYMYRDGISNAEYPDFIPIYARISRFLSHYPKSNDSWETVNRNLADQILKDYPMMSSFTSRLEVMPTKQLPYYYMTAITRTQHDRAVVSSQIGL